MKANAVLVQQGNDVARKLWAFAANAGFSPPQAYYIVGEFNLKDAAGESVYSDEAHLWCWACAEALLAKAHALLPAAEQGDHSICSTDAEAEDTCPHCRGCGEILDGGVSSYCVSEELAHYDEHPLSPEHPVTPRQAIEISQVVETGVWCETETALAVIALGKTALSQHPTALAELRRLTSTKGES